MYIKDGQECNGHSVLYTDLEVNILLQSIDLGAKCSDVLKSGFIKRTPDAVEHFYYKCLRDKTIDLKKYEPVLTDEQKKRLEEVIRKNQWWNDNEVETVKFLVKHGINEYAVVDKNKWIERKTASAIKKKVIYYRMQMSSIYDDLSNIPVDESLIDDKIKAEILEFVDEKKKTEEINNIQKEELLTCIKMGAVLNDVVTMKTFNGLTQGQVIYNYYKIKRAYEREQRN
jgi:hypothetical protein